MRNHYGVSREWTEQHIRELVRKQIKEEGGGQFGGEWGMNTVRGMLIGYECHFPVYKEGKPDSGAIVSTVTDVCTSTVTTVPWNDFYMLNEITIGHTVLEKLLEGPVEFLAPFRMVWLYQGTKLSEVKGEIIKYDAYENMLPTNRNSYHYLMDSVNNVLEYKNIGRENGKLMTTATFEAAIGDGSMKIYNTMDHDVFSRTFRNGPFTSSRLNDFVTLNATDSLKAQLSAGIPTGGMKIIQAIKP